MEITNGWSILENEFLPASQQHSETIFTIGNGYLGTRGVLEEGYPGEVRATFVHGVFDDVPVVFTELANIPDWMELEIVLGSECFNLAEGTVLSFKRELDLHTGIIRRDVRWQSPAGRISRLVFTRFASLAQVHLLGVQVQITAENYTGRVEVRAGINAEADNLNYKHWYGLEQGLSKNLAWLRCRTRGSGIELAQGIRLDLQVPGGRSSTVRRWDVKGHPTLSCHILLEPGRTAELQKWTVVYTSRDAASPLGTVKRELRSLPDWETALSLHAEAWKKEWESCDVVIEGDPEAQLAVRFNLFQLLVAAPRRDERVSIGAKTLSGYGYRGHSFWDTEIFMLPFFSYTRPEIARNLLSYRFHNLAGARKKAQENGCHGAQYPWESAGTGDEVTPTWVPNANDRTNLIRIWTGDIEVHISADIAYAIWQYWQASGDDRFMLQRGAEVILDTARFWASRVEWNEARHCFEVNDIIGPDEYHDHVDNNAFTNAMIRWHLQTALKLVDWLAAQSPAAWQKLRRTLDLSAGELARWKEVIENIVILHDPATGLYEQFDGYFQRTDVSLPGLEPRSQSVQSLLGIEGVSKTQVLKQPDVLMLFYLLPELVENRPDVLQANYNYYTPRTDHTFGSSLGPSIQAIMACKVGDPAAYEHFMRAARADLFDVRGNAGDGIHGASAGGLWQAVVFGFAGLHRTSQGWQTGPHLPPHWTRVAFKIVDQGKQLTFEVSRSGEQIHS
jgi:kojibiose phosphorylase